MAVPTPTSPPAGRYGTEPTPGSRRRSVLTLWALGIALLAVTVWFGLGAARTPVTWQDVGFVLDGADQVDVTYTVSRIDPSVPVQCRVHALNVRYGQVGVRTVDVGPSAERTVRLTTTIATSEDAVTGIVDSCWVTEDS